MKKKYLYCLLCSIALFVGCGSEGSALNTVNSDAERITVYVSFKSNSTSNLQIYQDYQLIGLIDGITLDSNYVDTLLVLKGIELEARYVRITGNKSVVSVRKMPVDGMQWMIDGTI